MYTIDASVWVNGFDQREPGHIASRRLLDWLGRQAIPIVIPNLALAEVAGAISRTRGSPEQAQLFANALSNLPNVTVTPIDDALVQHAVSLAANYALRGADAIYAAVALQAGAVLLTLDNEHLDPTGRRCAHAHPGGRAGRTIAARVKSMSLHITSVAYL
jgi:predicted nucleic acid-binding protein